ncbi:hypothetical protein J7E93_05305 [Streptomyces sp. ISL-36]|uniref:hypothetical protein n=1 Tax=Streptomyces sp. ISL-36 TaxID=2819182 RepID=UPI001BE87536|nr:hypothetical protein [Streptomyces sp. ISL-36]MBT2439549.1 hypothetical protein [Streptomyces sp. ISL-36]
MDTTDATGTTETSEPGGCCAVTFHEVEDADEPAKPMKFTMSMDNVEWQPRAVGAEGVGSLSRQP